MTNGGYEEAKAQRNVFERLLDKIPGFRGFQDRELRRDVDKLQREHISGEIGRVKTVLRDKARAYTDAGQIALLGPFDRLDRKLDGLSQSVRFADYGASGLFDAVKIGEPELQRLYEFDLSLLDDLGALRTEAAGISSPGVSPAADAAAALDRVEQRVRAVEEKWRGREQVISNVVRGVPGA
jgi:hypothetical protein